MITQSYLKEIINYCPESGVFTWRVYRKGSSPGDVAGVLRDSDGYRRISINGKTYASHRLAFLYMTGSFPENHIDHIDQIRDNNRWSNIRVVTPQENQKNRSMTKRNTSGFTGVSWYERSGEWVARIKADGKQIHLGYFKDIVDAINARMAANVKYGFHKNHGRPLS